MKEKRYKTNKPKWRRGVDMPDFSGKTWSELNDIWPAEDRVQSDVFLIMALFAPAWNKLMRFIRDTYDIQHGFDRGSFFLLCWMQRVQDAKQDLAFHAWPVMKGINVGGRLWYAKKAFLTKHGFIENMPSRNMAYRVTEKGKIIMKKFIEYVDESRQELDINIKTINLYKINSLTRLFGMEDEPPSGFRKT